MVSVLPSSVVTCLVVSELPSPVDPSGPGGPFLVINTSSKSYCHFVCLDHTHFPDCPSGGDVRCDIPRASGVCCGSSRGAAPDSSEFPIMARRTVPDSSEFPITARRAIPELSKFTLMARRAVSDSSDYPFTARWTVPELLELPAHSIMARSAIAELLVLPSHSIMATEAVYALSVTAMEATPGFVWFLVSALWWSSTLPWCHTLPCWSSSLPWTADPPLM